MERDQLRETQGIGSRASESMRRSTMLFVPGSDEAKMRKSLCFGGTPLIWDLEDAVAEAAKAHARDLVGQMLRDYVGSQTVYVRVNQAGSRNFEEDLREVVGPGLSGIVVPKIGNVAQMVHVSSAIGMAEAEAGLPDGSVPLIAIIETAEGVQNVREIAAASPRLQALTLGPGDLALDLGLMGPDVDGLPSPVLVHAMCALVFASIAAGLEAPHDGAYPDYEDLTGLERRSRFARDLGFGAKHSIHPVQIPIIEAGFRPSEEELERARVIVERYDEAEAAGIGAIGVQRALVDYPIAERARQMLKRWQVNESG